MRLIKKYKNRKIYDTKDSQYITMTDLLDLLAQEDIQIIDHDSKKDITEDIAYQAIIQRSNKAKTHIINLWKTKSL